jgi:hypothetical protein
MIYRAVESKEIVWCPNDDRYIFIIKEGDDIVGLNFMQGDELDIFKEEFTYVDAKLTDFYNAIEPYLDDRNKEVGKINEAIWAYHAYGELRAGRKDNNNLNK